jgi:hypothetical protein
LVRPKKAYGTTTLRVAKFSKREKNHTVTKRGEGIFG